MKKSALIFTELVLALFLTSGQALALTVSTPSNSWYKDSYTFTGSHSTSDCATSNAGTYYSYSYPVYSSGSYYFTADAKDNPFVAVNNINGSYTAFDTHCPLGPKTLAPIKRTVNIDNQAPSISLASSSASTTSSSYRISGSASDNQSGIKTVQAFVNGVASANTGSANFSLTIALKSGANSVYVQATDVVGHTTNSNTITITRHSSSGGSNSGGTTNSGSNNSSNGNTNSGGTTNSGSNNSPNVPKTKQNQPSQSLSDKLKSLLPAGLLSLGAIVLAVGLIYFFRVNRPKKLVIN